MTNFIKWCNDNGWLAFIGIAIAVLGFFSIKSQFTQKNSGNSINNQGNGKQNINR